MPGLTRAICAALALAAAGCSGAPLPPAGPERPPQTRSALADAVRARVEPLVDPSGESGDRATGVAVVVVTPDESLVLGLGAVRAKSAAPVTGHTVFQIGSVSKVFTGLMLASVIEDPAVYVGAQDPVNEHLEGGLHVLDYDGTAITLEDLASHRASLPRFPDNMAGLPPSPAAGYSRDDLAEFLSRHALPVPPKTIYKYSNLGSGLLGVALTDVLGAPSYAHVLEERLTKPLAMQRTGLNNEAYLAAVGDNLAQGYARSEEGLRPVPPSSMGVLAGAGEILSSGEDMQRWLEAIVGLAPFPVEGAVRRFMTPVDYGPDGAQIAYGVEIFHVDGGERQAEKAGVTAGYTCYVAWRPDRQVGVMILSNLGRHRAIQAVARDLVEVAVANLKG